MNLNEIETTIRKLFKIGGMVLIAVAALELAKFQVPYVPGEWWQIALGGMALKSF